MSEWGGGQAAYIRVAEDLRARIESGDLAPGSAVPSMTAIQKAYDVSNTTAAAAIRILKSSGLVESIRGKGVYVRNVQRIISRSADYTSPPPEGQHAKYRAVSDRIEVSEVVPPDDIAEKLGLEDDARALRRSRVMVDQKKDGDGNVVAETIVEIVYSYFPVGIARGTELDSTRKVKGGTLAALRRLGYPPRDPAQEWVDARMPTAEEARILDLPPGTPVLRLLRVTRSDGRRPVEALDMVFGAHRYRLEYDLPVHEE